MEGRIMIAFTLFHVALSLIGISAGFVVIWGFLTAKRLDAWTAIFLTTTVLTSVTGFMFPIQQFTPGHAVGILSLLALGAAIVARYSMHLAGRWRTSYVVAAVISQYFNFAVLIIQSFQKVPVLQALAPTQSEPPFLVTQLFALAVFVALATVSIIRFRPESVPEQKMAAVQS
jgi:hypothetical protein